MYVLNVLNQFDAEVSEVGFIPHPVIEGFGASPDGLVNDDGLIEIKCPNTWTHLETIKSGNPKRQYLLQFLCEVAGTMPVHIIAEKLERSPRAVCLKARYIGVRINPPHWNDEEISLITSGKFSNEEIAEKTGRSIPAISIKRLRLRNKSGVKCCTTSRLSFSKPNPYRKYINEFENNANYLSGICLCCHDDFCLF
ncbi:YqaJ viral recombinase family protein [Serratia symbiotica]|uniref:YqaJ viral recombinase family protein n=1 Tax=Serratia symbiotica TaxID=138074 RepID=UPI0032DA855A